MNLAGQIKTFVFDKTGTLTEEGLSVYGVRPIAVNAEAEITFAQLNRDLTSLMPRDR